MLDAERFPQFHTPQSHLPQSDSRPRRATLRQPAWKLIALLGALLGLGGTGDQLGRNTLGSLGAEAGQESAGWEGRRLVAQLLYAQTHDVMHAGAADLHTHPDSSHESSEHPGEAGVPSAEERFHRDSVTHALESRPTIPPADRDFRGVLGDLERTVKPYFGADGRLYEKSADQTIPLYRLMTWADPHFIQGYVVGATFVSNSGKQPRDGVAFLEEGARHNPGSFEIQTELGRFHLVYLKDPVKAEAHLLKAMALVPRRKLQELEADTYTDAWRWLALTYRELNRPGQAMEVARRGLRVLGEDATLQTILRTRGARI